MLARFPVLIQSVASIVKLGWTSEMALTQTGSVPIQRGSFRQHVGECFAMEADNGH